MPPAKFDACAEVNARNGLQHVFRATQVSVSMSGSVSVQDSKHAVSSGENKGTLRVSYISRLLLKIQFSMSQSFTNQNQKIKCY